MQINYVSKKELYPNFGFCLVVTGQETIIKIREDLPKFGRHFVLVHETYHATDKTKNWFWREVRANWAGFFEEPLGFFIIAVMSLAPYRLAYYWQRIKEHK